MAVISLWGLMPTGVTCRMLMGRVCNGCFQLVLLITVLHLLYFRLLCSKQLYNKLASSLDLHLLLSNSHRTQSRVSNYLRLVTSSVISSRFRTSLSCIFSSLLKIQLTSTVNKSQMHCLK